jgi:leader peptidase (prepilin peptidase)/N-methyltransferase
VSRDLPPQLFPVLATWSALVGALVGSFVNVVVARVPAGESIVAPRSRCPRCRTPIRWYDNVPVVSWLALRARCRSCGGRISARYPLVELMGAAGALLAFSRHGFTARAAAEFGFFAALLALALIDLDTWLLPHGITWPLLGAGLLLSALGLSPAPSLRSAGYGAGVGFAVFALIAWIGEKVLRKEALGFGDVWLLSALGAWMGVAALLPIALLASVQGSIVGVALIALGRGQPGPAAEPPGDATKADDAEDAWIPPRHAVPFGPFLVLGALEWLWAGRFLAEAVPSLALFL